AFFFSSRRRHTSFSRDWSSDVCSSDLAKAASERFAREGDVAVSWSHLWSIDPMPFHPELIELADDAVKEAAGVSHRLPSGPLHEIGRASCRGRVEIFEAVRAQKDKERR